MHVRFDYFDRYCQTSAVDSPEKLFLFLLTDFIFKLETYLCWIGLGLKFPSFDGSCRVGSLS